MLGCVKAHLGRLPVFAHRDVQRAKVLAMEAIVAET